MNFNALFLSKKLSEQILDICKKKCFVYNSNFSWYKKQDKFRVFPNSSVFKTYNPPVGWIKHGIAIDLRGIIYLLNRFNGIISIGSDLCDIEGEDGVFEIGYDLIESLGEIFIKLNGQSDEKY